MLLRVPETQPKLLWQGRLEAADVELEAWRSSGRADSSDLPIASIGVPEIWELETLYGRGKLPRDIKTKLGEADFHLVRLYCSFQSQPGTTLYSARFLGQLETGTSKNDARAFDLYPMEVVHKVEHKTTLTLSPSVKFKEVEAKAGAVEFGIQYDELLPRVSATGLGESKPTWTYRAVRGYQLEGAKWMHLIVRTPIGTPTASIALSLNADVVKGPKRIFAFLRIVHEEKPAAPLTVALWGRK